MARASWIAVTLIAAAGCGGAEDLREWKPSDHRHNAPSADQGSRVPQAPASAEPPRPGLDEVTLVTWRRNCTTCHGALGRGDGPQAPMTKPRDLADPAWQAAVTDEAIAEAIRRGSGRMPAFPLPEPTIQSLVQLVRLLGGQGRPVAPPPPASAPSAGSAAGPPPPAAPSSASPASSGP